MTQASTMTNTTNTRSDVNAVWVSRALWLAYLTIGYNLVEGAVSIWFGIAEESVALFGFGADSLIEVASAGLVLWRFRDEQSLGAFSKKERERRATLCIGYLFLALAVVTGLGVAERLWNQSPPETTVPGLVISLLSLSFMFFLWNLKLRAARVLDSATIRKDAACSMACIKLSFVLLVGSLLFWVRPTLWWVDAVAALLLAVIIGKEGWDTVSIARKPDFDGGCGCVH